jgi:hypothetical protein
VVVLVSDNKDQKELSNLDALHPKRLKASLAQESEMRKQLREAVDLFDATKRRGAGEVKAGLVGIRPSGMAASEKFHELFTETGKVKPKEKKPVDLSPDAAGPFRGPGFKVIDFPRTFCVLCESKNVVPGTGMLNFQPIMEPMPAVNLAPGDVVRCVICPSCSATVKKDAGGVDGMMVFHEGQMVPAKLLRQADRYKQMLKVIENVLRVARLEAINNGQGNAVAVEGIGS